MTDCHSRLHPHIVLLRKMTDVTKQPDGAFLWRCETLGIQILLSSSFSQLGVLCSSEYETHSPTLRPQVYVWDENLIFHIVSHSLIPWSVGFECLFPSEWIFNSEVPFTSRACKWVPRSLEIIAREEWKAAAWAKFIPIVQIPTLFFSFFPQWGNQPKKTMIDNNTQYEQGEEIF